MANYELTNNIANNPDKLFVTAHPIYGSSRLGVDNRKELLYTNGTNISIDTPSVTKFRQLGAKSYELSNHLGNVLVTVSDKRIPKRILLGPGPIDYFEAEITTISDYYAFGSPMPARQGVIQQCSTFNVTTTATNFAANETFSIGSVGGFVPGSVAGVTRFVNNPTNNALRITSNWTTRPFASRAVAVAANTNYTLNLDLLGFSIVSGYFHTVRVNIIIPGGTTIGVNYTSTGSKSINFSSVNAGNVTIQIISIITITGGGPYSPNPFVDIDNFSVTNIATTTTTTNVCNIFGGGYKFGFGGHEKDDEVLGIGNTIDMGDRWLDTRLGRTFKPDAKAVKYPFISPYAYALNNPIIYNDPDGKDVYLVIYSTKAGDVGHAAIAVSNYKKEEYKVMENGKEITKSRMVQDGTYTFYELGPGNKKGVGAANALLKVKANYNQFDNITLDQILNTNVSAYEDDQNSPKGPDGVIKLETGYESDQKTHQILQEYKNKSGQKKYGGAFNNCSDYVECGVESASGVDIDAKEQIIPLVKSTTPNKLYNETLKLLNAEVVKGADDKVKGTFKEKFKPTSTP